MLKSFIRAILQKNDARTSQVLNERDMLRETNFPNLNRMVTTTKDENRICIILELAEGADLV